MDKKQLVERILDNDKHNPNSFYERAKVTMSLFTEFIEGIENPFTDISDHNGRVCNMAAETLRTLILEELEKEL